jgi:predicted GNAT superfamily acetyltransferase
MNDPTPARAAAEPAITVRKCSTLAEFHDCVSLQRHVWQETDPEIEPANMFVVAANTGGQV